MSSSFAKFVRRMKLSGFVAAVGLSASLLASPAMAVTILTTTGNGADHYVQENALNTVQNLDHRLFARTNSGSSRHEVTYIRFDISSVVGTISGATLELYQNSANDVTYNLFGLNNALSETSSPWAPASLTYSNAPGMLPSDGNLGTSDLNPSAVTSLGSYALSTTDNETKSLSSAAITAFLNADTNGLVTFMFESTAGSTSTFRSSRTAFTGSEHGPRLVLTIVPEPGSIFLLSVGLAGIALAYARRKK